MSGSADTLPMTPFQRRVLTIPECHDIALLGARGSGKSTALALLILQHVELHKDNARVLLVRRSHHGVQHIHAICMRLFAQAYGRSMVSTVQPATIKARGAFVEFNQIESEADLQKYLGGNFSFVACDQADEFYTPDLLDLLRSLLRAPGATPTRYVVCANAGNVGSGWLKARFISPGAKPWLPFVEAQSGRSFVVARSKLADNEFVDQREYTSQLRASAASDPARLRQWLDDDWDVGRGGMFDDVWDRAVHVLEPFDLPPDWRVERSFDWGSSKPFSVGWWATADGSPVKLRNGQQRTFARGSAIRVAEWYGWNGEPNRGLRLHSSAIATGIMEREYRMGLWGRVRNGPADSSIFDYLDGHSIASEMAAPPACLQWEPAHKGPGSRRQGWLRMRQMLSAAKAGEGAGLFVFDTCLQFLRTVPCAPRDVVDPDDIDSSYEDHVLDESKYFLYRKPQIVTQHDMWSGAPSTPENRHELAAAWS